MKQLSHINAMKPDEKVTLAYETKYIKLYDIQYDENRHYYEATRRSEDNLVCLKSDDEFKDMLPDAVTCIVVVKEKDNEPKLLLTYEYRYPTGRFLLSPPAGLIDPEDMSFSTSANTAILAAARREILEETGIAVKDTDILRVVNPLAFSTPGMTDESNALALAVIDVDDLSALNQDGAVGSELFAGFKFVERDEASKILKNGRDEYGNFFSIYTWAALMYFVSGMWEA